MQCFLALVVLAAIVGFVYLIAQGLNAFTRTAGQPPELPARPRGRRAPRDCPGCGAAVRPADIDCPACGLALDGPTARRLGRLRTAQDEVRGLTIDGAIDEATAKAVLTQLERRARVLRGIPADDAPPPAPVAEPPLVVALSPEPVAPPEPAPPREEAPSPIAAPEPPPIEPQRAGGFAAFMEERNILWGELVGGLLIVGCSIALVVTLWQRLEAFPYFPFALSAAVTLALYGAGQYTLHHWKLTGTSRGLLVISLLLAPLNLLLLSDAITRGEPSPGLELGVKLSAVLGFAWVVRGGARDVLTTRPHWRSLLPLAVVGAATTQLLPGEWFAELPDAAPAWLALGCFAAACVLALRGLREGTDLPRDTGIAMLSFVGLAAFALAVAWGLHVARSPDAAGRVAGLALPLALAGAVVVTAGLIVQRRVFDGAIKTTGLAVALAGFVAMTGGLATAWPDPLRVLLVALATGLFLTRVAVRESLPWVHVAAIPALALGAVVGVHGLAGNWEALPLADLLRSAPSAAVLTGAALVLALIAEVLARRDVLAHALSYARGAAGIGLVALFLASVNGLDHPATAATVHAAGAAGLLAANHRWRLRVIAHGGLWLVLLGSLWTLHATVPGERSLWGFVVSVEALAFAVLGLVVKGFPRSATRLLRHAARDVAVAAAVLAPLLALSTRTPDTGWDTGLFLTLGLTGLALARLTGASLATYLGSASVFLGLMHLAVVTSHWEPMRRAVLVGVLAHATLAALAAVGLRHLERVFAQPLRTSVLIASGLAAILLFIPSAGFALQWAACAVWLALVWLALALAWRERGAFSVFQVALSLAAILCVVAWLDVPTTARGYFEPVALHSYSVALALLALGWVGARRVLRDSDTAHALWTDQPWSAERVVLAAVVVGQLAFAAMAVGAEVRAELTPVGWQVVRAAPAIFTLPFGAEGWIAVALLTIALLASWRLTATARDAPSHLAGLTLLFLTVPVVWAKTHAGDVASASALRWGLAVAFAVGTAVVSMRVPLRRNLDRLGFVLQPTPFTRPALLGVLAAAAAVVVYLSAQVAELGLTGRKPSGPVAASVFAAMGTMASTLVPLALVVLGLACSAGRERSPGYAFAGGMVFVGTVAAGYALGVVTGGGRIDGAERLVVCLLACGGAAVWAAAWLAAERRVTGGLLLAIQSRLGLAGLALLAFGAAAALVVHPQRGLIPAWEVFGRWSGVVLALASGVAVWRARRAESALMFHAVTLTALVAGVVVACAVQPRGVGDWLSFHVLAGAWAAVAVALVIATRKRGESSLWLDGLAAVLALMALRAAWHDPWRPWMPAGLAAVAALAVGAGAVLTRSPVRMVASGLLVNVAAILLWLPMEPQTVSGFLLANAAGLAVAAAIWTTIALRLNEDRWRPALDVARGLALVLLWFGLAPTLAGDRTDPMWLVRGATIAVACAMLVALHDARAFVARGGLYTAVLALFLLGNIEATTRPLWNHWATPFTLAYHALVVSGFALYIARREAQVFPLRGDNWGWLVVAQGIVAAVAIVLGVRLGLTEPELRDRLAVAPFPVLLLLGSAALLLRAVPVWANLLRFATVALGVLVLATVAWAMPDPAGVAPWLQRHAWLFVALAAAGVAATELASRVGENWRLAARSLGGLAAGLAVAVLCVNLIQQVPVYNPVTKHTPLEPAAVFAMLIGVLTLAVLAIRFALDRARDPLALPDHRRTLYVYLAEFLVVLFFAHVRFNVPELFLAAAVKYWTFAVMGLAFGVVLLAEIFERRRLDVLAVPLRRTGVLLPLLPLLAFWAKPPAMLTEFAASQAPGLSPLLAYLEKLPQQFDLYAWLWFLSGGLYGLVALWRNSFGWALLAALSTNAALWALLTHNNVPFALHPQAWVIPLALIVLVSEHVNRHRLRPDVSNAMRYAGIGMIYIASSADMFIAGVGQSVWFPVILAVLCVLGVLAGIALRVRAFVFLGVGFLLLDVFAMIWHAAVDLDQTWVWYASGIVLGVAILTLFAVFEKRKAARGGPEPPAG